MEEITFDNPYWSEKQKISYLQRRIIVHSVLYYELDSSIITDARFDDLCKQLVNLQKLSKESEFKRSTYYYAMYDFDGSTGFNLYSRLKDNDRRYLMIIAHQLLYTLEKSIRGKDI
jgi:hypothetical protein